MSKAVLISIQPKWCELIVNGKKTIEVRKSRPKLDTPFKCYIYCTEAKNNAEILWTGAEQVISKVSDQSNGKVIGYFVCDEILDYKLADVSTDVGVFYYYERYITQKSYDINSLDDCLTDDELLDYGNYKNLYGWHISDLKVYDKPKELSEFYNLCDESLTDRETAKCKQCIYHRDKNEMSLVNEQNCVCDGAKYLIRPPQSWYYVEEI